MSNEPLSEQFRVCAKEWVEADAAANILEETKSAVLSQMMLKLGDMPVSRAEMQVKASPEWTEFLQVMVNARERANLLKVKRDWIVMRQKEWISHDANARAEMKL